LKTLQKNIKNEQQTTSCLLYQELQKKEDTSKDIQTFAFSSHNYEPVLQ